MTRSEAIHILDNLKPTNTKSSFDAYVVGNALTMAIKALEQEPCEDAISRKKVIDTIYCECSCENLDIDFAKVLLLQRAIKALPSVSPQQKIGKWIYSKEEDSYRCSLCNFPCHKDNMGAIPTRYCAECGAVMEV